MKKMANIILNPGKEYSEETRKWQGVPSIEKTGKRLWAAWFTGGKYEPDIENYAVVAYSDDDGKSWVDPYIIIDGIKECGVRIFDPQLWQDNNGKLWFFWCQDTYVKDAKKSDYDTPGEELTRAYFGKLEQWVMCCDNPEDKEPVWSAPRFMYSGFTKNNVEILNSGRWLISAYDKMPGTNPDDFLFHTKFIYSDDEGESFYESKGLVENADGFCEPMTVQLKDGTLWCLIRTLDGYLDEAFSYDNGESWTEIKQTSIPNPSTRFFVGRLKSGELLLVNTPISEIGNRTGLVASISEDEGKSWKYNFCIDNRRSTTYPDVALDDDGYIYLIYDCQRDNRQEQDEINSLKSNAEKEICFAKITAEDIKAGRLVSEMSSLRNIISKVIYDNRELG